MDRIQFKVKLHNDLVKLRIAVDPKIDISNDDLYDVLDGESTFWSKVESDDDSLGYRVLHADTLTSGDETGGTISGTTTFTDEAWVTFYLNDPFPMFEEYHILLELSEDGTAPETTFQATGHRCTTSTCTTSAFCAGTTRTRTRTRTNSNSIPTSYHTRT